MINASLFGLTAVISYSIAFFLSLRELIKHKTHAPSKSFAWLAAALHSGYTTLLFQPPSQFNLSFFNSAALVALCLVVVLLLTAINKPVEKLGIIIYPLTAILVSLDLCFPEHLHPVSIESWPMRLHILSALLAFSLLNIAALQAILLAFQHKQLRRHPPSPLTQALPPLQAMETLLFQMISAGLLFLTIGLGSGFLFIEDLFAQHLVHKTVLSLCAWLLFSGLLIGRMRLGWRGKTAIHWTLAGFLLLLLAYFGSKLVLELILNKN